MFGFLGEQPQSLRFSLSDSESSLMKQSERNPDGWGVAYYYKDMPQLVKKARPAAEDIRFLAISEFALADNKVADPINPISRTHSMLFFMAFPFNA